MFKDEGVGQGPETFITHPLCWKSPHPSVALCIDTFDPSPRRTHIDLLANGNHLFSVPWWGFVSFSTARYVGRGALFTTRDMSIRHALAPDSNGMQVVDAC